MLLMSCASGRSDYLGSSTTLSPGWHTIGESMANAVRDPNVWGALLGAAMLQVDDVDRQISEELREETPLFGNNANANERSDDLRSLTSVAYIGTALLTEAPAQQWWSTKARLLGMEWLTVQSTRYVTTGLKTLTKRDRPNERDDESFPSGHTSRATIQAQMANLNVDYLPISDSTGLVIETGFNSLAALTGWARVEAGLHYPSDVLAGWALGHFMSHLGRSFITDQGYSGIQPLVMHDSVQINLWMRF
jgi:hypothetical protein